MGAFLFLIVNLVQHWHTENVGHNICSHIEAENVVTLISPTLVFFSSATKFETAFSKTITRESFLSGTSRRTATRWSSTGFPGATPPAR